jgi:hypothetical protein
MDIACDVNPLFGAGQGSRVSGIGYRDMKRGIGYRDSGIGME